jgi:hypothetical protein
MPTRQQRDCSRSAAVTGILVLIAALVLAGAATFVYFGGYWYQYWYQHLRSEVKLSRSDNFRSADDE